MDTVDKKFTIKQLKQIPGVGVSIANDLYNIGICKLEDLKGKNADDLFDASNKYAGTIQDRCLLYVFRCAIYYAETDPDDRLSEKLKWWNWK